CCCYDELSTQYSVLSTQHSVLSTEASKASAAMTWAVLGLVLFGLFLTYIIFQETRAHTYWRGLVLKGDISAIRALLDQEIERWQTMRVPKGTSASLWHGVQTVDLVGVGPDAAHVVCSAEGEYRIVGGQSQELTSPMDAAIRLAAKVCE